jgi:hypothetical protein
MVLFYHRAWISDSTFVYLTEGRTTMEITPEEMTDVQLHKAFEDHDCSISGYCDVCYEYMRRFNPDRLQELGWEDTYNGEV